MTMLAILTMMTMMTMMTFEVDDDGDDYDLLCSNGDPMPAVTWRKAGVPVNPDGLDTDAARWSSLS